MRCNFNLGKILTPYLDLNHLIIDPTKKSKQINKIYHEIRKKYPQVKPTVYLIRHTILKDMLGSGKKHLHDASCIFYRNKFELFLAKKAEPIFLLIYRSPDNYFYPISYSYNENEDDLIDPDINKQINLKHTFSDRNPVLQC